jgi:hypothetical protein
MKILKCLWKDFVSCARGTIQAFVQRSLPDGYRKEIEAKVVEVLVFKIDLMPRYMGFGIVMLTHFFNIYTCLFCLRSFQKLNQNQQMRMMNHWRNFPVALARDLIKFYERLPVFIYYSQLENEQHTS